jgi:glycosyltransferase involved in cell wall biosynthesis
MKKGFFNTEAFSIEIPVKSYDEMHGVTICCVMLNEEKEIKEFLEYYRPYVKNIVMIDGGSTDKTVEIASPLVDIIKIIKFDGHYSNQMNRAISLAQTDWVLHVDCDERIQIPILKDFDKLINQEDCDCWSFPRKNYIDGVIDESTFPEYQERLYRAYCRRIRPVHGEVVGYKKCVKIEPVEGNFIIHSKTRDRHDDRNKGYLMYELKYKHEMGSPGTQTKEIFEVRYPLLNERNYVLV